MLKMLVPSFLKCTGWHALGCLLTFKTNKKRPITSRHWKEERGRELGFSACGAVGLMEFYVMMLCLDLYSALSSRVGILSVLSAWDLKMG